MRHSETVGDLQCPARQVQSGTVPRHPPDLEFLPGNAMLNAGAERLGPSLFRRETRSKTLREVSFTAAKCNLLPGKNLPQTPVAEAGNGLRDALDFHNVDSSTDQHESNFLPRTLPQQ